jgi:hypothetical protein
MKPIVVPPALELASAIVRWQLLIRAPHVVMTKSDRVFAQPGPTAADAQRASMSGAGGSRHGGCPEVGGPLQPRASPAACLPLAKADATSPADRLKLAYFLTYLFTRFGPTSAPRMLPIASAATPSAALVPVALSTGSGMNAVTTPSLTRPTRMPRFQPS